MCSRLNKFIPGWCQIVHLLTLWFLFYKNNNYRRESQRVSQPPFFLISRNLRKNVDRLIWHRSRTSSIFKFPRSHALTIF